MKRLALFLCSVLATTLIMAQDLYVRGAHNSWAANAADKMTETSPGIYTISNYIITGAFKIADASWSSTANWGAPAGGSTLVTPGTPFTVECGSNPANLTVAQTTVCQLITLNTNTSTLLIEEQEAPPAQIAGPALWPVEARLVTAQPEQVKVLSMNNSLIHYENEWQDAMFNSIAAAMEKNASWTAHTNLGKTLDYHYEEGEGLTEAGTPSARMLIRSEAWTHIILQEQTAKPRTNYAGFRQSVIRWIEYIRANCPNPNAIIIVPVNWAYNTDPFTEFNAAFLANYRNLAQELGVVICPVGLAYQMAYENNVDVLTSWFKDDRHPTQRATYMAACLEYATIFGEDPAAITWKPSTITDAQAEQMRTCAHNAWQAYKQTVDIFSGCVHYELRLIDTDGLSVQTLGATGYSSAGNALTDSTLCVSAQGTYTVEATYDSQTYSATVICDTVATRVVETDAVQLAIGTYTQNFDSLGVVTRSTADAKGMKHRSDMPYAWRIERNINGPRQVGSFFQATDTLMYFGGVSLASNAYNGTWNWGADDSEDRAVGGLTTGVDGGTRGLNIMLSARNPLTDNLALTVAYNIEKYRGGNNGEGFTVQLYYSPDGVNWTSAGADFTSTWAADAATQGYTTVPSETRHIEASLPVTVQAGTQLFLAWNISVTNGTNCAGAQGLAIDDVVITAAKAAGNENISAPVSDKGTRKIMQNGQLLLLRDGRTYSVLGTEVAEHH
ncbi:MAG: DUF4886 domain-containing protein [Paludibacteraceae bacterium]|nr:DUF4886 domain-containing protein [Paludibacteraceae bacterium]